MLVAIGKPAGKMAGMKLLAIILLMLPAVCMGDRSITDPDTMPNPNYVEDTTPWKEFAASLPAYPKNENLIPFDVSSATANKFMIDAASLSVGEDGVVRYTVVIESPRGARTVNFEGMRCDPPEFKIYGFGQENGEWTENKRAAWQPFKMRSLLSYHKALFEDHFCPNWIRIMDAEEGIYNLKHGGAEKPQ